MARYTDKNKNWLLKLPGGLFGADKVLSKKNYPPDNMVTSKRKDLNTVVSSEKQKQKYTGGVLEKQFRNLSEKASRSKGITGEVLLQLLGRS